MLLIIIPITSSDDIFLILRAKSSTNSIDSMEPINAVVTVSETGIFVIKPENAIVTIANSILAPEDMPSTKGPAIGFRKNVCKRKPERESAPPRTAAMSRRGNRIIHIIS